MKEKWRILLFNTTCDNWASAPRARHKCIALLRKHKLCGYRRLRSFTEFEITNQRSTVQSFDLISIGKTACPLEHIQIMLLNQIFNMINTAAGAVSSGNKSLWSLVISADKGTHVKDWVTTDLYWYTESMQSLPCKQRALILAVLLFACVTLSNVTTTTRW